MDAFDSYVMFLAMRAHFNQKGYSYVKYNGKIKANYDSFMRRNDRYFFHRLGKKNDPEGHALANLLEKPDAWVTDMLESESDDVYFEWVRRWDSMSYVIRNDLAGMEHGLNELLSVPDGQHPLLLEAYLEGDVCHETMVVVNELTSCFRDWNRRIEDPIIWPGIFQKLKKYREFIPLDARKDQFRKILVDKFSSTV